MKTYQKIAVYSGVVLTIIGVMITWSLHWVLGLATTGIALFAYFWWKKMKTTGDSYLKELAEKTGLQFKPDNAAYGHITGNYKGYPISITVTNDYNSDMGLLGFVLSTTFMESPIGVQAGIENFTIVKIKHNKTVVPIQIDNSTYLDENVLVYRPPFVDISGLPQIPVNVFKTKLDIMVDVIEKI